MANNRDVVEAGVAGLAVAVVAAPGENPVEVGADPIAKKQETILKEKRALLDSLAGADFSQQRTRVAFVLNMYPAARNSDVVLSLKYWETFQPETYNPAGIKPEDFFKLERVPILVRARAKIQNEYELFQADDKVRRRRRGREEEMRDAVLEDAAPRQTLHVFSDETGKTEAHVIVGSVWVLNGRSVYGITKAIDTWKEKSTFFEREMHFAKLGKGDLNAVRGYLDVVQENREYLSFKLIAVPRGNLKRPIEDTVQRLHEFLLLKGLSHEVGSGRVGTPRYVTVTLDHEQSLDRIALEGIKGHIALGLQQEHGDAVVLEDIQTISSRKSALVQLSDMIAGAANRRLNFKGDRNHKDEVADLILDTLGIELEEGRDAGLDAAILFRI